PPETDHPQLHARSSALGPVPNRAGRPADPAVATQTTPVVPHAGRTPWSTTVPGMVNGTERNWTPALAGVGALVVVAAVIAGILAFRDDDGDDIGTVSPSTTVATTV